MKNPVSCSGNRLHVFDTVCRSVANEEKLECKGLITGEECIVALKSMANNKTPGPSGFTKEFFLHFLDQIGELIVEYVNDAYHNGEFFVSHRRGYVTLLPKKATSNKRLIVLLDIIYKIVAKVLAKRVTNIVDKLVGRDQTGFMKGRNIGENIRLMSDVLHYC